MIDNICGHPGGIDAEEKKNVILSSHWCNPFINISRQVVVAKKPQIFTQCIAHPY